MKTLEKKKGLFPFKPGDSTKNAHIEYYQFPKSLEFEHQFYSDTIEMAISQLITLKTKKNIDYTAGITISTNTEIRKIDKEKNIPKLEEQIKKPYFGRLDIVNEMGVKESIYIGKDGFFDEDSNIRVYNIRSSYGALYNQHKVGQTTQDKIGEITINLRRHIENENGQIIDIHDLNWDQEKGYLDPVLEKRLNKAAKAKLSEIWETIQAEQDAVMREDISKPVIIQGSAGSGKTVIALHRISYLLYEYESLLKPNKILVLAPNKMYLNYIKDISPEISNVNQSTFEEYCISRIPFEKHKYKLDDYFKYYKRETVKELEKISINIKGSLEFKNKLEEYLNSTSMIRKCYPERGISIKYENETFNFEKERLQELYSEYTRSSSLLASKKRVLNIIKQESKTFGNRKSWHFNEKKFDSLVDKEIKRLDQSWKVPNVFDIYFDFCTNIEIMKSLIDDENANVYEIVELIKNKRNNKLVTFDDLPALLLIQKKYFEGIGMLKQNRNRLLPTQEEFDYVLVDEVQDYSPFHVYMINQIVKNSRMTLMGDLGQGIFYPRGIKNWRNVVKALQVKSKDDYKYIELGTIYRSTIEIVNYANMLIKPMSIGKYNLSKPVGRKGTKPKHKKFISMKDQLSQIENIHKELESKSYESIAIITKDWEEAFALYNGLRQKIKDITLLNNLSKDLNSGVIISPVYLTKGFEYDAVIIANASMDNYNDSIISRKLLYVAVTRALHDVYILYRDNLSIPILEIIRPTQAKRMKEEIRMENELKNEIAKKIALNKQNIASAFESQLDIIFREQAELIYKLKKKIIQLEQELEYYKQIQNKKE
ncbi:MAG: UvrD-helicase domain-containing protein [Erysipelothrix sp.]|nr:UvrD-helicase domain-containing protein [Erysipelothrix sp.]